MKIWTELEHINGEGKVKVGVHIETKKSDGDEIINHVLDGVVATMEIIGIIRALKDYDEIAFNLAMERFIEEELAEVEEVEDNE